ncbi:MAG TPA: MASE1 domain-containing protein [Burkholderiales bacterium]|nr:MASE1 domain-containing protein [Burkholderiales bacterium]
MKVLRYLRDAALFAPCYGLLDWVSYIHPLGPFNITPWNPQPALAIAWMLLGGLAHAPAVWVTIVLADGVIRKFPAGYGVSVLAALALAAGYAAIAWALRMLLRPQPNLRSLRQLTLFVGVVAAGTVVVAAAFVYVLYAADALPPGAALPGWLRFWVGDAVGVLVTAPLLLVVADAERRANLRSLAQRGETYAQIALVAATLWLIFAGLGGDPSHHFYLLFPPLIWVAIRGGIAGAIIAIAIVQLGVVLGIHHRALQTLPVLELQALVAALTLTVLYLGVMVEERERAAESLKESLRLAAAGEMAGAIAHEVNQPLTALANYGRSGQMMIEAGRNAELGAVIERMLAEAQRASEVVRRLRDFFRQGATRLEQVPVSELLEAVRPIAAQAYAGRAIALSIDADQDLPDMLVDRLQIELVLRNLITNAIEAVEAHAPGRGQIAVTARRDNARHVRIVVSDNGPGVSAAVGKRAFEPFVSGKPSGMGLGLAVSRAIAEAHGGTLEARAASHGEFHLVLPTRADG